MNVPHNHVSWKRCWRVFSTHYPAKDVFQRLADEEDRNIVEAVESMTKARDRLTRGEINVFQPSLADLHRWPSYVLAPFVYTNPNGSRFSDGTYGVYYAGKSLDTAITETKYHRVRFLRDTRQKPQQLGMKTVVAVLDGKLHDLRHNNPEWNRYYHPDDYTAARALGKKLRNDERSSGIVYNSVRQKGGQCVAVFHPQVLNHCREDRHLVYEWNGETIDKVYELHEFHK